MEEFADHIALVALDGEPGVYVVGGAVRDVLLGRTPKELDFVVEGEAASVARRAAERVNGRLVIHDRFGTATVHADGESFDLVSARTERYPHPGALPEVTLGATIEQDLARRDFTINAIAVGLRDGRRVEWPGASDDLRDGVLRVLHDRSFIDDPTRMLRLARYAARLGFAPDPHTAQLVDPRLYATVSGDRLGNEARLALQEHALGALEPLFGVSFADGLLSGMARVPNLKARLDHLGFTARERDAIVAAARLHGHLDLPDAELWRRLRRELPETIELLAAENEGARRWRDEVSHRSLDITGHDLVERGLTGVAVGEGLARATVAMLEGRAPDRAAQLAAALGA